MNKFKKQKKYSLIFSSLIAATSFAALTFSAILLTSNSIGLTKQKNNKINFIGSKKQSYDYKNALEKDVIQKSKSDSVLLYYINWYAVFHRFGSSSHLIKILELNPNKEIYFIARKNVNLDLSHIENNKEKFPNFNFVNIDDSISVGDINFITNGDYFPFEVESIIDTINMQNKKIDFYSDDYFVLKPIETITKNLQNTEYYDSAKWNQIIKNIYSNFKKLKKMNSINLFADGTASSDFYSNSLYNSFLFSGNKIENDKYLSEDIELVDKEIDDAQNLLLFLSSLITTNNKGNNVQKTKFFLPTTQMIDEINDPKVPALKTNNEDFFNPYNSLEANLINFCSTFNVESWALLNSVFYNGIFNPSDYEFMNNNNNYVYSGRLLSDTNIDEEVRKILQIKSSIKADGVSKYNIIFKGHPRDESEQKTQIKLRKRINELDKSDDGSWLFAINPKIPYEIYMANGTFDNNMEKNKIVKLYTTHSTINLFLYAEDSKLNKIQKILINHKEKEAILHSFGEDSKIFPKSKWQNNDKIEIK